MNRAALYLPVIVVFTFAATSAHVAWSVDYPGKAPGPAVVRTEGDRIEFSNQILSGSWGFSQNRLQGTTVRDQQSSSAWESTRDLFRIVLADDTTYPSSSLKVMRHLPCSLLPKRVASKSFT